MELRNAEGRRQNEEAGAQLMSEAGVSGLGAGDGPRFMISHRDTEAQRSTDLGRARYWESMAMRLYEALLDQKGAGRIRLRQGYWRTATRRDRRAIMLQFAELVPGVPAIPTGSRSPMFTDIHPFGGKNCGTGVRPPPQGPSCWKDNHANRA